MFSKNIGSNEVDSSSLTGFLPCLIKNIVDIDESFPA
jgi:hypothetical protein